MVILRNKIGRKNLNKGDIDSVEDDDEDDDVSSLTNYNTKAVENQDGGVESPLNSSGENNLPTFTDFKSVKISSKKLRHG
jgi:hypothetical protein